MRDVLVTGGAGRLGRRVVDLLRVGGIEPRVMSRSGRPGNIKGDLLTGEGLEAAVRGATRVFSEESMAGPLLVLLYNSAKLRAEMEQWLSALKSAAEAFAEER